MMNMEISVNTNMKLIFNCIHYDKAIIDRPIYFLKMLEHEGQKGRLPGVPIFKVNAGSMSLIYLVNSPMSAIETLFIVVDHDGRLGKVVALAFSPHSDSLVG